jgi:SNF2 family DNA or RNA helicase
VIDNWERELKTWGHFAVSVYQGNEKEKELELVRIGINDIMICGISHFKRSAHLAALEKVPWKLIIADEFHDYKNVKANCYANLASLRTTAKCPILGLTGTIMSNSHEELWSLIDLVQPNHLGTFKFFDKHISGPMKHER